MSKLIGGRIYVAPNKTTKVRIYPHGYVEPVSEISQASGERIQECSAMAKDIMPNATPFQIFEFMGWTEETP